MRSGVRSTSSSQLDPRFPRRVFHKVVKFGFSMSSRRVKRVLLISGYWILHPPRFFLPTRVFQAEAKFDLKRFPARVFHCNAGAMDPLRMSKARFLMSREMDKPRVSINSFSVTFLVLSLSEVGSEFGAKTQCLKNLENVFFSRF